MNEKLSVCLPRCAATTITIGSVAVSRSKPKPLHFTPHMANPQMLTAEGEEVLRDSINKRIGGVHMAGWYLLKLTGTDIELEVLFDAAHNGGVLDWADVIPKIDGQGLCCLLRARTRGVWWWWCDVAQ